MKKKSFARREAVILRREARSKRFWGVVERITHSMRTGVVLGLLITGALVYALHAPVARLLTGGSAAAFAGQELVYYIAASAFVQGIAMMCALYGLASLMAYWQEARLRATDYRCWIDNELATSAAGIDTLREIADTSQNSQTRERAASRIGDKAALRALALTGAHDDARSEAALVLGDQAVYLAMLPTLTDAFARARIAGMLKDPPALARLARDDPHENVRRAALRNVQEAQVLAHTLLHDVSPALRRLAAEKLKGDPATPGNVQAESDWPAAVRRAINRATLTDADECVRTQATKLVTDQRVLSRLAQQGRSEDVRRQAVARLTDQAALAQVAFTEPEVSIRCDAIRKIESQQTLFTIASEDRSERARLAAVGGLRDEALLLRYLLFGNTGAAAAEAALARLYTDTALLSVAKGDLPDALCAQAARRLSGATALADAVQSAARPPARAAAAGRLADALLPAQAPAAGDSTAVQPPSADAAAPLPGVDAETATAALCGALRDENHDVRLAAAATLKKLYLAGRRQSEIAAQAGQLLKPHADHSDRVHTDTHSDNLEMDCANGVCNEIGHTDERTDEYSIEHSDEAEIVFTVEEGHRL